MRYFIWAVGFALCLPVFSRERCFSAAADQRPNILILLADDLGYGEIGSQEPGRIPTPNIDRLAAGGVMFTAGYVTAPNCSPSRAGLLTGRYQTRFGHEFNPVGAANADPKIGLPLTEKTLPQALHDLGYATGLIGKWHLGGTAAYHPQRRGFDEFFGFLHEGHFFVPPPWKNQVTFLRRRKLPDGSEGRWISDDLILSTHMRRNEPAYDADNPILRGSQPVEENAYLTQAFTREAVDFIGRHTDRPFCLMVAYNAVHSPLQAPKADLEKLEHIQDIHRRIFAGMLVHLDKSVGEIMDSLKARGLEENTLVCFLSDNGGPTRELTSRNTPLRGEKGQMYEGGVRVPFVAQWKNRWPAGKIEHRPVLSTDLFATALAAAGGGAAGQKQLDGVDLAPFMEGKQPGDPHETFYWRQGKKAALRHGDWKIVRDQKDSWELYQLVDDISETRNLAANQPQKLKQLTDLWETLDAKMAPSAW